jgi:hypothetical protein
MVVSLIVRVVDGDEESPVEWEVIRFVMAPANMREA